MARPARQNLILAACVLAAGFFIFFWVCPYLALFGHQKLCIAFYVVLLLIYVYGRASIARPHPRAPDRNAQ
jgi:hypothetical protein